MGKIEFCDALISLVEKNGAIWDTNHSHYHDNDERLRNWLKIFNELKSREDCTFDSGKFHDKRFNVF